MRFELYFAVILLILLSSCSGADRTALSLADSVMEENPDSALNILLTIDRDRISDRDLPYYALLMTQAMVKTDVPVDSDSLIYIAYTKYSGDWRGDKGIRASFYMGEVFYNQENPRYAMRHYLSAYEEAKKLCDHYWHAKAAERIADLFFDAYKYDEAVKYRMEAIENYGKSNRISNQRYAITDLTAAYNNNGKKYLALHILDSLMYECNRSLHTDENLIAYILQHRVHTENWHTPIRLTLYEDMTDRGKIEATILSCNSELWKNDYNRNDSALRNIERYACDKEDSLHILYSRYLKIRSYQKESPFLKFVDSLLYMQEAITKDILTESIDTAESEFYLDRSVKERQKLHIYVLIFSIFIAFSILGTFAIWKTLRLKNAARTAELEANVEALVSLNSHVKTIIAEKSALNLEIENKKNALLYLESQLATQKSKSEMLEMEASEIRKQIEDYRRDLEILKNQYRDNDEQKNVVLENLFKEKWYTLNMLCVEYFEKGTTQKLRDTMIRKIEREVKNIGSPEGLHQIEMEVDRYMNGILAMMRKEFPGMKEEDIALFSLSCAGFSVKAICLILNIKDNNLYVRKSRLLKKLRESDCPNKEVFIERLS